MKITPYCLMFLFMILFGCDNSPSKELSTNTEKIRDPKIVDKKPDEHSIQFCEKNTARTVAEKKKTLLLDAINHASDSDDISALLKLKDQVLNSKDPDERYEYVIKLGLRSRESLPELIPFLVDDDENVSDAALHAIDAGVSQIEDQEERGKLINSILTAAPNVKVAETLIPQFAVMDRKIAESGLWRIMANDNDSIADLAGNLYLQMDFDSSEKIRETREKRSSKKKSKQKE